MGFAPKTYDPTKTESSGNSRYFRIKKGDSDRKIRILSNPFDYYVYWTADRKKVVLQEQPEELPMDIKEGDRVNLTWAVVILDRSDNKIKIWEITQKTIRQALVELSEDEDWGHPCNYDIKVKRSDENDKTSYMVTPSPKTPVDGVTMNLLNATPINLNGMLTGADPFKGPHSHLPEELQQPGQYQTPAPAYTPPAPAASVMHQPAKTAMTNRQVLLDVNAKHIRLDPSDLGIVIPLVMNKLSTAIGKVVATADVLTQDEFKQFVDWFLIVWADQVRVETGALPVALYPQGSEATYRATMALYQDPTPWRKAEAWTIAVDQAKKAAEAAASPQQQIPMTEPGLPNYQDIPF